MPKITFSLPLEASAFISWLKANQKRIFYGIKITVTLATIGYLAITFKKDEALYKEFFSVFSGNIQLNNSWELIACLGLMPLNWLLEALKWRFLASKIEKISVTTAVKGTLAGLALGFITPHAVGDYAARLYYLKLKHKIEAFGALLLTRVSMFYVSLFYGIVAFYILNRFDTLGTSMFLDEKVMMLTAALAVLSLAILMNIHVLDHLPYKHPAFSWVWHSVKVLGEYTINDFATAFLISFVRYSVFSLQYLLLLKYFGADIYNVLTISSIWMVFFVKSVFPNFSFLNDLGVREIASVYFFTSIGIEASQAVLASLTLWLINILTPTLLGLAVLLTSKYKKVL